MSGDGTIRTVTERQWSAEGVCRIARDRASATVTVRLATEDDEVVLTATWHRDPPESGCRCATRWMHCDCDGGRWSVEFGYDGRWWCVFGPDGVPWGSLLQNTITASLTEATEYMARGIARSRDLDRAE